MNTRRPLSAIPRVELLAWQRKSRLFKAAWRDVEPFRSMVSQGRFPKWVFAIGFLYGQQSVRHEMEEVVPRLRTSLEKTLKPILDELAEKTRMGLWE